MPFAGQQSIEIRAIFIGERVDLGPLSALARIASVPAMFEIGEGVAAVFRYGALVLFGVGEAEERDLLSRIQVKSAEGPPVHEVETARILVDPELAPRAENDVITVSDTLIPTLQVVAEVLARSVALNHYEDAVAQAAESISPLAEQLRRGEKGRSGMERGLLKHIGTALAIQQRMVGRLEVREKPEVLWDVPSLERLFVRLEDEYELTERDAALDRKLELIHRTATTLIELQQDRRSTRLEWYIIVLIGVEIALYLYEMFAKG